MATQLRLVEPPPATPRPARSSRRSSTTGPPSAASATSARTTRTTRTAKVGASGTNGTKGSSRRAAHWGDWQLDTRTRTIGRAGIAAARAALEQATEQDTLPRAS